ncbi:hypothetical protein KI387_011233, partial [Taxus chinensis]
SRVRLDKELEANETLLQCAFLEKEKGKRVYLVDDKEVDNLDVNHSAGRREVLDSVDKITCTYHEPMKIKQLNIGI